MFNAHHVKVMKVALVNMQRLMYAKVRFCCFMQAVVIIRQKPMEIGVKEFIGRLAVMIADSQVDWKSKVGLLFKTMLLY